MLLALGVALCGSARAADEPTGRDAVPSRITIVDVEGKATRVIHKADRRVEAPNWSPDGSYLLLNSGGRLWRLPVKGGNPRPVATPGISWVDINHGIDPKGKRLAITAGPIFVLPAAGGEAKPVTSQPGWFHSWSPDGRFVAYTADRGGGPDLFAVDVGGGPEARLTSHNAIDDCPDFSPDGRWIYFNSNRSGNNDIWRIPAAGAGPNDFQAEQVTRDALHDWFPHPSPDGKWLVFLSYPEELQGHPTDEDVMFRRIPLPGAKVEPAQPEEVVRFVGGHGAIGSEPWSPDGKQLAYASYEPPAPELHIVFFTPSDVTPPPVKPVRRRLTQAADAAERFLVAGMRRWKYPPANERIFQREPDGAVKVLFVKGDKTLASGAYQKPFFAAEAIERASKQYKIAGEKHLWWIFSYLGDPPRRVDEYRGHGDPWDGGWAVVNYSTIPGELLPAVSLAQGFNATWTLKGIVHELGHTFGLPHIGPEPALGLGNSLMGPNNDVYAARKLPRAGDVYLTEAAAAMLWKHPIFAGTHKDRARRPVITLDEYRGRYDRAHKSIALSGRVTSGVPAHSVVVLDDLGQKDQYWFRGYAGRVARDGTFEVTVDSPVQAGGTLRILFCCDNGAIAGDYKQPGYYGAILKTYGFRNGQYEFAK